MSIRPARYSDLDSIADILTAAFWNGDIVGRFMHPYREKYPQDFREWWKRRLRALWWDRKFAFLVSTDGNGDITGFAKWAAHGTSAKKVDLWRLDPRNIVKLIAHFHNILSDFVWPNRAADPTTIHSYEQAAPLFNHHWTGLRSNGWQLETLGVHPDCQGKGYGKMLVIWGLDKARKERVPASVVSAEGKEEFYIKCGFDDPGIVGNISEGEGNPLHGVKGGAILFKDSL